MVETKPTHVIVLGISAFYHDSAAVIIKAGGIIAAAHEERFTRKKHDASFPVHAISYCLEELEISLSDVDYIVFYDKPFLKLERLLETYLVFAPRGILSFVSAATVWIKEKFLMRRLIKKELRHIDETFSDEIFFSNHHLSHAASAFYPSPFEEAAILTIDGVGEWTTTSISVGEGNTIKPIEEIHFPHSIGLLYSAFTYFLGFRVNSGEYKLMGLAPYGNRDSKEVKMYKKLIQDNLVTELADGSFILNQNYFNYATGTTMIQEKKWEQLFNMKRKTEEEDLLQHHSDLALAVQLVTEEMVIALACHAKKVSKKDCLVLAGGVALNCVANARLLKENIFKDIWIQPAAGDAGGALGAALAFYYLALKHERSVQAADSMKGSFLGPSFSDAYIESALLHNNAQFKRLDDKELFAEISLYVTEGNVVGWFQGRMEWGPRALGNRSILADPRNKEMQKKLNLRIKFREGFRPFAPSVLYEHVDEYFEDGLKSPYMLFVSDVIQEKQIPLPKGYGAWDLYEKLYFARSDIPAVTHIDYSARLQTVHRATNKRYWELIEAFYERTGCPLIINTSFNVRGEPIVCTPEDALNCFMQTDMDYLVLNNYVLKKSEQSGVKIKKRTLSLD